MNNRYKKTVNISAADKAGYEKISDIAASEQYYERIISNFRNYVEKVKRYNETQDVQYLEVFEKDIKQYGAQYIKKVAQSMAARSEPKKERNLMLQILRIVILIERRDTQSTVCKQKLGMCNNGMCCRFYGKNDEDK